MFDVTTAKNIRNYWDNAPYRGGGSLLNEIQVDTKFVSTPLKSEIL